MKSSKQTNSNPDPYSLLVSTEWEQSQPPRRRSLIPHKLRPRTKQSLFVTGGIVVLIGLVTIGLSLVTSQDQNKSEDTVATTPEGYASFSNDRLDVFYPDNLAVYEEVYDFQHFISFDNKDETQGAPSIHIEIEDQSSFDEADRSTLVSIRDEISRHAFSLVPSDDITAENTTDTSLDSIPAIRYTANSTVDDKQGIITIIAGIRNNHYFTISFLSTTDDRGFLDKSDTVLRSLKFKF